MADTSKKYAQQQLGRFDPSYPQLATVMDNRDPTKSGKLKVWIQGSQSDKNSKESWIEASYMSPFAGKTPGDTKCRCLWSVPERLWLLGCTTRRRLYCSCYICTGKNIPSILDWMCL